MIEQSFIRTAVWPSELVEAQVILAGQEHRIAGTDEAALASAGSAATGDSTDLSVLGRQPSFAEMTAHLDRISPFAKDLQESREFQRRYIDAWNRILEQNLTEIEEGDKQGVRFYYYQIDRSDSVCRGHLLHKTFVSRTQIHAVPQVVPPFHLGCSCRLKRFLFVPDCPSCRSLFPLFTGNELPVLPDWRELAEVPGSANVPYRLAMVEV